ncbi:ABC-three component system middle component 6 [Sulfuritalea sp.]|uniref:ABC-three component system middle component 6 n=1 Tax=Sulfuritalea sp. TaxID=2480090 RepID=UPI00286E6142|nr:ABC-three component system middle component 6 [Sulfuritalea sp.]
MILPTKHLPQERALLTVGGALLAHLELPITVSALWQRVSGAVSPAPTFDWFVLALDLLHALGAVELRDGLLVRGTGHAEAVA